MGILYNHSGHYRDTENAAQDSIETKQRKKKPDSNRLPAPLVVSTGRTPVIVESWKIAVGSDVEPDKPPCTGDLRNLSAKVEVGPVNPTHTPINEVG